MRQIGFLADQQRARVFTDFLTVQGVTAHAEQEDGNWVIWVRDENDVERARSELTSYQREPDDARYQNVTQQAEQLKQQIVRERQRVARQTVSMRQQWNQPLARRAPLVMTLIGLCIFVGLVTGFGKQQLGVVMRTLSFADGIVYTQTQDGLRQIREGQIWRLVTPIFLHFGPIHLVFNLFWLYYLGTQIEVRRGTVKLGLIILGTAVFSNALQYIVGRSPMFLGISGVNYGLLGYIWMKKVFDPRSDFFLSDTTIFILLFFMFLGFAGILDGMSGDNTGVANWAHAGGLLAGMAIGYAPVWWQRRIE
jgi:GlpG protein